MRNWQNHQAQVVAECSFEDCDEQITIDGYPGYAVRRGWAIHNNEWICPTHLAVVDATKESKE